MSAAITVWVNDLRGIIRDRTAGMLLLVPLILLVLLRFGYPLLERQVPQSAEYRALVLAGACLITGTFPALITSFIMLDERDQGVFVALRVLPVPAARLLGYRLIVVAALSLVCPLLLIIGSGLIDRAVPAVLVLALLCALGSPVVTLFVVATAGNKIEGLTLFKAIFFGIALAGFGAGFSGWWTWPLAAVPTFWIYLAFDAQTAGQLLAAAGVAGLAHAAVLVPAYRRFRDRV